MRFVLAKLTEWGKTGRNCCWQSEKLQFSWQSFASFSNFRIYTIFADTTTKFSATYRLSNCILMMLLSRSVYSFVCHKSNLSHNIYS